MSIEIIIIIIMNSLNSKELNEFLSGSKISFLDGSLLPSYPRYSISRKTKLLLYILFSIN